MSAFQQQVEAGVSRDSGASRGVMYDLEEMFQEINGRFFKGVLSPCRLEWGRQRAHNRTGLYDPAARCIRISPVLDDPSVPSYVVEFVLYHEMLHLSPEWVSILFCPCFFYQLCQTA